MHTFTSRIPTTQNYKWVIPISMFPQSNLTLKEHNRTLLYQLNTLYLFTKSDFKTVVLPQSAFALAAANSQIHTNNETRGTLIWRLPSMVLWIWIHLLIENISNQRLPGSVLEDTVNKPWRPIPSGRLTPQQARSILRTVVPVAMSISAYFGSLEASLALMVFIWLYNDLDGSNAGPLQRNVLNAAGLSCFGWGAVSVLLHNDRLVDDLLCQWLMLLAAVITTTVHAQDFPDLKGDTACGRITMPLLYGQAWSRYGLAVFLILWSVVCPAFWKVHSPLAWAAPLIIGSVMAGVTSFRWESCYDLLVWRLWCLWIGVLYVMPLFGEACLWDSVILLMSSDAMA